MKPLNLRLRLAAPTHLGCINSDLIIGFENETHDDMLLSIDKIKNLDPDNISIHPLAIKKKKEKTDKNS